MAQFRKRLARFMKKQRGSTSYQKFAAKCQVGKETMRRIELEEQNVTIDMLEHFCKVFQCNIEDILASKKRRL